MICCFSVMAYLFGEFFLSQLANELNKLDEKLRLNEALLEQKVCNFFFLYSRAIGHYAVSGSCFNISCLNLMCSES